MPWLVGAMVGPGVTVGLAAVGTTGGAEEKVGEAVVGATVGPGVVGAAVGSEVSAVADVVVQRF